jgi:hypothetical protein
MNGYLWNYTPEAGRAFYDYAQLHWENRGVDVDNRCDLRTIYVKDIKWEDVSLVQFGKRPKVSGKKLRAFLDCKDEDYIPKKEDYSSYLEYLHERKCAGFEERKRPLYKSKVHKYVLDSYIEGDLRSKVKYEGNYTMEGELLPLSKVDIRYLESLGRGYSGCVTLSEFRGNSARLRSKKGGQKETAKGAVSLCMKV